MTESGVSVSPHVSDSPRVDRNPPEREVQGARGWPWIPRSVPDTGFPELEDPCVSSSR